MQMTRRGFLKGMAGILAAGVAPAFVGSKVLMPVRELVTPEKALWIFEGNPGNRSWVYMVGAGLNDPGQWKEHATGILTPAEERFEVPLGGAIHRHQISWTFER